MADGFNFKVTVEIRPQVLVQVVDPTVGAIAHRVLEQAIKNIGTQYSGHHKSGKQAREKLLRESGRVEPKGKGSYEVIFENEIAEIHHEGASAHSMPQKTGKKGGGTAPFYVRTGPGGYSFGPTRGPIAHPGSKANPYLSNAATDDSNLQAAGALRRGPSRLAPQFRSKGFFK